MPDETTFPRTRSAKNEVLFQSAKGTSTKPAKVVSLNSIIVTKSCMDKKKKAKIVMSQARNNTAISTILTKNATGPVRSLIVSKIGDAASNPVLAINPGRIRSAGVRLVPVACNPSPEKLSNIIVARNAKLPII